jgi:hypothetical protein
MKKKQCVFTAKSQIMEQKEVSFAVQQHIKHLYATMEELLGVMFPV